MSCQDAGSTAAIENPPRAERVFAGAVSIFDAPLAVLLANHVRDRCIELNVGASAASGSDQQSVERIARNLVPERARIERLD
jgi:hypothetical protein